MNEIKYSTVEYHQLSSCVKKKADKINKKEKKVVVIKGEKESQYVYIGLGERRTGGYDIEIKKVENVDDKIFVIYKEIKPESGSMVIQVITYPYNIIRIDSSLTVVVTEE
ncbi:MAG: protease complex subunit PrcB family protein [Clostridia bacterium]|nr:protease complex subunit PrcB family protein [Clostridia bacterium]